MSFRSDNFPCTIAYDTVLRRPACVLIQPAMGGTVTNEQLHMYFPVGCWLLAPTENMGTYPVESHEQLLQLGAITEAAMKDASS